MIRRWKNVGLAFLLAWVTACGKNTTAPIPACSIIPVLGDVAFGNVTVGSSKDVTVALVNLGTRHLSGLLVASPPGGAFALVGSSAYELDPEQFATFTVRFQPPSAGNFAGVVATSPSACQATCTGAGLAGSAAWMRED